MTEPLVFQHGVATKAFDLALGVWVAFEIVMSVRQAVRLGRRPARDPSGWILGPCMFGSVFAAINLGRHEVWLWPGGRLWPVIVGLVMIAAGIALRAWSIATLGRFFQYRIQVQSEHRVITHGPYRYVRHPSYSGLALVILGIAVASGSTLGFLVAAVLTGIGLAVRIHAEEKQLTDALGEQYERYASARKRLIPGVW